MLINTRDAKWCVPTAGLGAGAGSAAAGLGLLPLRTAVASCGAPAGFFATAAFVAAAAAADAVRGN